LLKKCSQMSLNFIPPKFFLSKKIISE